GGGRGGERAGGADGDDGARQPGRARPVRRSRTAATAEPGAAARAVPEDLSRLRARGRALLEQSSRAPHVPASRGAGNLHRRADPRDHLHRAEARAARAPPRARPLRLRSRRAHRSPRLPGDAGGVVGRVRGCVTPRGAAAELIRRKRDGALLTDDAIATLVAGIVDGSVSDAQIAAFAMAVYFRGMTRAECAS